MMLHQNSVSTASEPASADGQEHSFLRVAAKRGWNACWGAVHESAMLTANRDSVTYQIIAFTLFGTPFWKLCSAPNVLQVPSRSSMPSAGTNRSRSSGSFFSAIRLDSSFVTATRL